MLFYEEELIPAEGDKEEPVKKSTNKNQEKTKFFLSQQLNLIND